MFKRNIKRKVGRIKAPLSSSWCAHGCKTEEGVADRCSELADVDVTVEAK